MYAYYRLAYIDADQLMIIIKSRHLERHHLVRIG